MRLGQERREGVTEAAGHLQHAGLIRYKRGRIMVLDRAGLEKRSCECYAVVRNEYRRLLPTVMRTYGHVVEATHQPVPAIYDVGRIAAADMDFRQSA